MAKKIKILIVEDDDFFRDAIKDVLAKTFTVFTAPNGKSAKEIIAIQELDIVLTDIQMPNCTGIELLEWSKQNKPVPFIIMTGFSTALETQSAFDLGAQGFLAKPFKNTELIKLVESICNIGTENAPPQASEKKEYCKVPIDEFVSGQHVEFDVYIKLSETKVVKLAHKGEEIPKDKIVQFKNKGLKYLYILAEDFNKLIQFNLNLTKIIKDRSDISNEKKLNFIKYTGEVILEKTFITGVNESSFQDAKKFIDLTLNVAGEEESTVQLLDILNNHSNGLYAHALGVSMYSVMIAKEMGIESNVALFKLSMAGLFHDIGKKEIDPQLLEKPRHLLTNEERKTIESHVIRGQEILASLKYFHSEVIQMVLEHHEDLQGSGYPFGKRKLELHPLSKILQVANVFIGETLTCNKGQTPKPPMEAILYLEKLYEDRLEKSCWFYLKKIFS